MTRPSVFLIGHPIGHSRSPMMHGYWLGYYGIEGSYEKLDVPPEGLGAFFARFRAERCIGANVTIPHKLAVMDHVDRVDEVARAVGAVNCLFWESETLVGGNTDVYGFMGNLDHAAPGWDENARNAVILGAGGAARAAAYGLKARGLAVALANRTRETAETLVAHLGEGVEGHGLDDIETLLAEADLLVNTTSLGMVGQPPLVIDLAAMKPGATVYDVVYAPLETEFLVAAAARGLRTVDGLGMLIYQGIEGFARWFDVRPEATPELRKLLEDDIRGPSSGA